MMSVSIRRRSHKSRCGTYGCMLPDKHCGLHQVAVIGKRRRPPCAYSDFNESKHAVLPVCGTFEYDYERGDVLITNPLADLHIHRQPTNARALKTMIASALFNELVKQSPIPASASYSANDGIQCVSCEV